jgi:hypothetical protein
MREERRYDGALEDLEGLWITEELRDVNQDRVEQRRGLRLVRVQDREIRVEVQGTALHHPSPNPPGDARALVVPEINPRARFKKLEDGLERSGIRGG